MFRHVFSTRKSTGDRDRREAPLRCSFCNKSEHDVRKLIAGPTVFICDECVAVCNDILTDSDAAADRISEVTDGVVDTTPSYPVACSLCHLPVMLDEAVAIPERGFLCGGCTSAVQAALVERGSS
jgi:hypothetical protein